MKTVLVRVTGRRQADSADIEALAESAGLFVQAFQYRRLPEGLFLLARFDGQALEAAAAARGLPVWGRERPEVLAWFAADYGGGNRAIIAADSDGFVATELRRAAAERGVPLRLPLMDAEDRERVSFADIWGGFSEALESASGRYAPDAVLTGRVRRLASGRFSVDWSLSYRGQRLSGRGAVDEGIHSAADYFAEQFAITGNGAIESTLVMEVAPLVDVRQYAGVLAHLQSLSVVETVMLRELNGETATFALRLRGDRDQLRRALELGQVLVAVPDISPPSFSGVLRYRPLR